MPCPLQSQEDAEARYPLVILFGPGGSGFALGVPAHGAEFINRKSRSQQADPFLAEDRRPRRFQLDDNCDESHQRRGQHQQQDSEKDVHGSFQCQVDLRWTEPIREDEFLRGESFEPDLPARFLA